MDQVRWNARQIAQIFYDRDLKGCPTVTMPLSAQRLGTMPLVLQQKIAQDCLGFQRIRAQNALRAREQLERDRRVSSMWAARTFN